MTERAPTGGHPCGDECDGEMHECYACGGEGTVLDDCFEDSCCCADPESEHDIVACEVCGGEGYFDCPVLAQPFVDASVRDTAVSPPSGPDSAPSQAGLQS